MLPLSCQWRRNGSNISGATSSCYIATQAVGFTLDDIRLLLELDGADANCCRSEVRPLATVVIGGLISSTLLTLVVLPALYRIFTGWDKTGRPQPVDQEWEAPESGPLEVMPAPIGGGTGGWDLAGDSRPPPASKT